MCLHTGSGPAGYSRPRRPRGGRGICCKAMSHGWELYLGRLKRGQKGVWAVAGGKSFGPERQSLLFSNILYCMCDMETAGFFMYDLYRCFRFMLSLWKPSFSTFKSQLEFKMSFVECVFDEVNWRKRKLHRIKKHKFHILSQWLPALNFSCRLPRLQLIEKRIKYCSNLQS